jgi:hypothetical protein
MLSHRLRPVKVASLPLFGKTDRVHDLGKFLFIVGLVLMVVGAIVWKTGSLGGLGRLPGDIFIQKGNSTFSFPIVTCLLISALLTLLAWVFRR